MTDLRQKLAYIAAEKFNGRGNGTPELNMAADYIAGVFQKSGLKPVGDAGTFFQRFDIYSSSLGLKNDLRIQGTGDAELDLKVRADFIPEQWSVSGTVTLRNRWNPRAPSTRAASRSSSGMLCRLARK